MRKKLPPKRPSRRKAGPACSPALWPLEAGLDYLNHGAFGSCPREVLAVQQLWRARMERQPIQFFVRDLEGLLDVARASLARFVGAAAEDLVFVPNATAGINTVLRSLSWKHGDELLTTNHEYNASRNAVDFAAARQGARLVVAPVPFPVDGPEEIVSAVLACVTERTRLVLLDHVTSQTGLIFPVARLVGELTKRGIDTVIDGAHAPGMVPLNLRQLGAAYYTGNCHKWVCAPKGAGFLYVQRDRQEAIRPLVISHGANSPRTDRSRFLIEFGWTGTGDPSACLSVGRAVEFMSERLPGGWPEVMRRNHALAVAGRRIVAEALGVEAPCPDGMIGALAAIPIPDAVDRGISKSPLYLDPLQEILLKKYRIEVPIIPWPASPRRLLRISAQLYNSESQYERLAVALGDLFPR